MRAEIAAEVRSLNEELRDPKEVRERVSPYIEEKIDYLRDNFPEEFGPVITDTIRRQIAESQDEVIDALYPIIGKLVRRYIIKEIEKLSERLDRQVDDAFSWERWKIRIRSWFTGVKEEEMVIRNLAPPVLEEIMVVGKESGLLLGSWSRHETLDRDMVAGMLTAIKSFVEDAFSTKDQSLELIEYETYKIYLQNFPRYYIAAVISGVIDSEFKDEFAEKVFDFGEKNHFDPDEVTGELQEGISRALAKTFGSVESAKK